jgi:hypothetical protein
VGGGGCSHACCLMWVRSPSMPAAPSGSCRRG